MAWCCRATSHHLSQGLHHTMIPPYFTTIAIPIHLVVTPHRNISVSHYDIHFDIGISQTLFHHNKKDISSYHIPYIITQWRYPYHTTESMMTSSSGNIFRVPGHLWGGIHRPTVNSPHKGKVFQHKGQWRGALMFSLICALMNDWVKNREAGDLRRHRTHYDVTVIHH